MLSVRKLDNSKQAGHYFSAADYYVKGEVNEAIKNEWLLKFHENLGLKTNEEKEKFSSLLDKYIEEHSKKEFNGLTEEEHRDKFIESLDLPDDFNKDSFLESLTGYEDDHSLGRLDKENESIRSEWNGKLAEKIGLKGDVDIKKFVSLLDGHIEDQVLGRIGKGGEIEHKSGWDFTFSAPKSVSILAILGGDKDLLAAHHEAVKYSLGVLEDKVITRKSTNGILAEHNTKNALFASFTHTTSRSLDPQLHTHNVLINATEVEGRYASIESSPLYDAKMSTGLAYRVKLAELARELGHSINFDHKTGFFEINSVSNELLHFFSKRSIAIREKAAEMGVTDSKSLETIAVNGRSSKQSSNVKDRFSDWEKQLKDNNLEKDLHIAINAKNNNLEKGLNLSKNEKNNNLEISNIDYEEILKLSFEILSERECSIDKQDVISKSIMTAGIQEKIGFDVIQAEKAFNRLVSNKVFTQSLYGQNMYTTPAMLKQEQYIVKLMESGKGASKAAASIQDSIEYLNKHHSFLNESQLKAASYVTSSKDQFIAVQGSAGVGKTTMTKGIKDLYQVAGFTVKAFAPTNGAANVLGSEIGVDANTLASHLFSHSSMNGKLPSYSKDVWLVDEASLINNEAAADLMTLARRTGAKVVLMGDKGQLAGVEAGKPFELLQSNGIAKINMDVILRQKGNQTLLEGVQYARDMLPSKALDRVRESVRVGSSKDVVTEYLNDVDNKIKPLLMIPDNITRIETMKKIRDGLIERGYIDKEKEIKTTILESRQLTRPEKSHSAFYQVGDVVEFGNSFKKINVVAGERYQVIKSNTNGELEISKIVNGKVNDKSIKKWNPNLVAGKSKYGVEVYKPQERSISKGDELVIKKTVKSLDLKNGMRGNVISVDEKNGTIKMDFGNKDIRDINLKEFKNIDYAYAVTMQTAQGMTHDKAIFLLESWRRNLVNSKSFYVALSRAKFEVSIHTDNKEILAKELESRKADKTASHSMNVKVDTSAIKSKNNKPKNVSKSFKEKALNAFKKAKLSLATGKETVKQRDKIKETAHEQAKDHTIHH